MEARHKVYYFRVLISSLAGLASGLIGLSSIEGLSLFLLTYFLVTPISLRLWGNELKDTGLIKLYREAIGSSFLAFLLVWVLVVNLMGLGVSIYIVRTSSGGIYPIQTLDGRTVGPDERPFAGYNAVFLNVSNGKIKDIYVGTYAKKSYETTQLYLSNTKIKLWSNGTLLVEGNYNLSLDRDLMRIRKLFKNVTLYRNGSLILNGTKLRLGYSKKFTIKNITINITYTSKNVIHLRFISGKDKVAKYPTSVFISFIEEKGGYVYVFDSLKPVWKTRTARVDESYLIILPSG